MERLTDIWGTRALFFLSLVITFALLVGGCEGDWQDLECKGPVCSDLCVEHGIGYRGYCETTVYSREDEPGTVIAPWAVSICICVFDD